MDDTALNAKFEQVDGRFAQVDARFEQVDGRFAQVDARFAQVDGRFAQVDGRFEQVDARFAKLEDLIKSEGINTRRHFDVVAEGLKGQVKLIAEGHSVLADHIVDVKGGLERLEAGQTALVLRVSVVESRVTDLEKVQRVVLAEVRGLAARR